MRLLAAASLLLLFAPAWASNPGEPLDCSDWVMLEPGFVCTNATAISQYEIFHQRGGALMVMGNSGNALVLRRMGIGICGTVLLDRHELLAYDGNAVTVIGYIDDRCADPNGGNLGLGIADTLAGHEDPAAPSHVLNHLTFDEEAGAIRFPLQALCLQGAGGGGGVPNPCSQVYAAPPSLFIVSGFATTFEIMQTYEPTANQISFRVPAIPEGFQSADWFNTYYGDLATVGDWSQAQPLQCSYPASMPTVGDYLTINDPLPDPAPGTGRYYLTVANYQGERRFGRRAVSGQLSGRDPAALPACP